MAYNRQAKDRNSFNNILVIFKQNYIFIFPQRKLQMKFFPLFSNIFSHIKIEIPLYITTYNTYKDCIT